MSAVTIEILPAAVSDLPAITRLAEMIWRAHYPGIISPEQIEYMLNRMYDLVTLEREVRDLGVRFERLLVDGALAGFAAHGPTLDPRVRKLHKLYLHPQWQGRGLGSRLLRHCEEEARRLGAQRMVLTVNRQNLKAVAAYRRNQYRVQETVVTPIGNGFVMDDFLMAKTLEA